MFWIASKIFWIVAQPAALIGLIILAGFLVGFGRHKRLGQTLVGLGLILFFLVGFTNMGLLMLQPLEARYQRPDTFPADAAGLIVLGGGTDNVVSQARGRYELAESGDRFVEAVRLALAHPALPIVVSGGNGRIDGAGEGDAAGIARLFGAFGLNGPRIRFESTSRNTYENATHSAALIKPQPGQRFVLITSAFHMPRSAALFKAAGFDVVPWPVDERTTGTESFAITPTNAKAGFATTTTAVHEWIGLLAYWISGKIPALLP